MFSLDLDTAQDDPELLLAELYEAGSCGIVELSSTSLRAFFDDEGARSALETRFGAAAAPTDDRDWIAESRQALQPLAVGERFYLVPEWMDDPAPPGRFRITVNNGQAFGTGLHETTRLCLRLLEQYVRPGMTVVDIGTGSGILAEAARLLGAATVIACDLDPLATAATQTRGIPVFEGTATALASASADLIVANVNPEALAALAPEIGRILKPAATAILSGLEGNDPDPIKPAATLTEGSWKALVVRMVPSGCALV